MNQLPETGFLRLEQIIGCRKKSIPPIIPISKSSWWVGIQAGRYPEPVRLSANTVAWRVEDIRALIERLAETA